MPVLHLASSLAALLNPLDGFSSAGPSASPSACALFIIALEGQAASSLPSYTILARELGAKAATRKDLVIERYRDISKIIECWMADVPWLGGADHEDNRRGSKRRKISRRDAVARGVRDVVQFRESIMKREKNQEKEMPVMVALEVAEESDGGGSRLDMPTRSGKKRKRSGELCVEQPSRILRLLRSRPSKPSVSQADLASLSLLSPSHPFSPDLLLSGQSKESRQADSLQNQILTSSRFPPDVAVALTRLQQLAISLGGECEIGDDELFDKDELESFLRSEDEVMQLRRVFGWDESNPDLEVTSGGVGKAPATTLQPDDWEMADLGVWEDMGNDKNIEDQPGSGEQIVGEWREVSPFSERVVEEGDNFDVCDRW